MCMYLFYLLCFCYTFPIICYQKFSLLQVITTGLFPHQKQALAWMVSRENTDELPPFWEQTKTGLYKSSLTNFQTTKKPCDVLGGMLADDMGLGKTLSIISLIVTNFRKEKPLVTIDKSVLVTVEESKVW